MTPSAVLSFYDHFIPRVATRNVPVSSNVLTGGQPSFFFVSRRAIDRTGDWILHTVLPVTYPHAVYTALSGRRSSKCSLGSGIILYELDAMTMICTRTRSGKQCWANTTTMAACMRYIDSFPPGPVRQVHPVSCNLGRRTAP